VGLVAADLFRAGMGQNPAITKAQATQPSTPAIRYLRSRRPNRFAGLDPGIGPGAITPDVSMRVGLFDARSYDFPVERRYSTLWRRAIADGKPPFDPTQHVKLTPQALPALRLLSVTDIVQDPRERAVTGVDLPLVYRRPDARIYGNPNALPRALVVEAQQVVSGDRAELDAVLRPGFDGRRAVVTAAPLPGLSSSVATGPASGSARIVSYARQRVMVAAVARRSAELVLTDTFYPGWKATVDGKPVPVHRVDYLLRGVTLAPGHHVVTFRYEPKSWRIGWIVSLLAALGLAVAAGVGWRARRHSPPGTGTH
jgi:membrane protein YfhO